MPTASGTKNKSATSGKAEGMGNAPGRCRHGFLPLAADLCSKKTRQNSLKSAATRSAEGMRKIPGRGLKYDLKLVDDFKGWIYEVRSPAAGAAAGTGQTPAVFEHITAVKAFARPDGKFFAFGRQRSVNVSQVLIYFFFLDSHLPGQLPGIHFSFSQKRNYFLAYGRHCL